MLHFVVPYKNPISPVFGWELMFMLRSIESNFKDEYDITIIGDLPPYLNPKMLTHIPIRKEAEEKELRISEKYLIAADLFDNFLVIHDDMYLVNKCTTEELTQWHYLEKMDYSNIPQNVINTFNYFKRGLYEGYRVLEKDNKWHGINYVCHTPFYLNSKKLKELSKIYSLKYPMETFYGNYFNIEAKPLNKFRSGHYTIKDSLLIREAKILNHDENGYICQPWIINLLFKLFPKKSKYEI